MTDYGKIKNVESGRKQRRNSNSWLNNHPLVKEKTLIYDHIFGEPKRKYEKGSE